MAVIAGARAVPPSAISFERTLLRSVQQMAGAQFGKTGEQRTESVFAPLK